MNNQDLFSGDPYAERMFQHLPTVDDLLLITLKGHLLVEEVIEKVIDKHCKGQFDWTDQFVSFSTKLALARALVGGDASDRAWVLAAKLNALRNKYAHRLEGSHIEKARQSFLKVVRDVEEGNWDWDNTKEADRLRLGVINALAEMASVCELIGWEPENPYED